MSPVNAPVNSMTLFADSAEGSALPVVKVTFAEPATDFARYPFPKVSISSKLLFVLVPQVLALAPLAISSIFNLSVYVLIFYKYISAIMLRQPPSMCYLPLSLRSPTEC